MARSKSDISNSAIRIFLQKVGKYYDVACGFDPFGPKVGQKDELLRFFENSCCFCGKKINRLSLSQDHLIPMNKQELGLHAWGNVVPTCLNCNNEKQQKPWRDFIKYKAFEHFEERTKKIEDFVYSKNYDPNLDLHGFAGNLYEDIGEVAMTLIDLRYKQAQSGINKIITCKED